MEIEINCLELINNNVIDIRENYEYNMGHIDGAKNITIDLLLLSPERYLSKNKIYYLYCGLGIKSLDLSKKLNSIGYKTYSLKGGYKNLKAINNED